MIRAETVLAYAFYGHDNESYAFVDARKCDCGKIILNKDLQTPHQSFLKIRTMDVSSTYDGAVIVSEKFKKVYSENHWTGLEFRALPGEHGFYLIVGIEIFRFDRVRRKTIFSDQCEICGEYRQVAGSFPVFFMDPNEIPHKGFARSDIEFGSNQEKHSLLICSASVGKMLENQNLEGLDLIKISQS